MAEVEPPRGSSPKHCFKNYLSNNQDFYIGTSQYSTLFNIWLSGKAHCADFEILDRFIAVVGLAVCNMFDLVRDDLRPVLQHSLPDQVASSSDAEGGPGRQCHQLDRSV